MLALFRRLAPRRRVYLPGLLDHYAPVARSLNVLDEAFGRYRRKSADRGYQVLASQIDVLEGDDLEHWHGLLRHLEHLGTPFRPDPLLVRGLDYYRRTLFEIRTSAGQVGAQNAIGGGGRYDGLVAELGGPDLPSIGFALGIERILLAMSEAPPARKPVCWTTFRWC